HDAGVILHPQGADGQIYGGFAQGVGAATLEEFSYGEDGSFLSGTFADYRVPTAHEVPVPIILHQVTPSPVTPLGAKGIGEGNNMSTPVCIANAIADAIGVEDVVLPATPPRVHALLVQKGLVPAVAVRPAREVRAAGSAAARKPSQLHATGSVELGATPEEIFAVLLDAERLRVYRYDRFRSRLARIQRQRRRAYRCRQSAVLRDVDVVGNETATFLGPERYRQRSARRGGGRWPSAPGSK